MPSLSPETTIFKAKRTPVGLIGSYILTILAALLSIGLSIWMTTDLIDLDSSQRTIMILVIAIVIVIVIGILFLQTIIYWSNSLTLTEDEIRQSLQTSIFSRKVSRLGLANIEDVTVVQKGILAMMFNYGTVKIETAGEQSNFTFKYCPKPSQHARAIMSAREGYLEREDKPTRRADVVR